MTAFVWLGAILCALACSHQGAGGFFSGAFLGAIAGFFTYLAWKVFQVLGALIAAVVLILIIVAIVSSGSSQDTTGNTQVNGQLQQPYRQNCLPASAGLLAERQILTPFNATPVPLSSRG